MKLKQLWETAPMMSNKKIAALLASASAVIWAAGFILVTVSVKVGLEMLFIFTFLFMLSFIAFTWQGDDKPNPEHRSPKNKDHRQPKDY